jgi:hypothetical protein
MVPLPTAIKPVVVSELGMNGGGEAVLNKEDNCCGGEESDTSSKDNTGYTSPCDKEANRGGEEATDKDNKSIKSMKSVELENICASGHRWEEGNKPSYAVSIGIFTGRECFGCWALVVDGVVFLEGENTWKIGSGQMRANHCMKCNICACSICRQKMDMQTLPCREKHPPSHQWE